MAEGDKCAVHYVEKEDGKVDVVVNLNQGDVKVKFEKPNNASKATAWNFVKIIGGRLQLVPSDFEIFREVFDGYIAPQEKTTTTNLKLDDNYDPIEEE